MEAISRISYSNNWITFIFLTGLVILFFLKQLNPATLNGYFKAFFFESFIKEQADKRFVLNSFFDAISFVFIAISLALALFFIIPDTALEKSFKNFFFIFILLLIYLGVKMIIDLFISIIFNIEAITRYFRLSKAGYLYTISLWIFPVLILHQYSFKNPFLLQLFAGFFIATRFVLIIVNNKKLILNKLFYFILYFCTLELAPLLIIYKTTTL